MAHLHPIKVGLVDDHTLFRRGLASLFELVNKDIQIAFEANNGHDLKDKISLLNLPDIVTMDVNMPGMDGFSSVQWLADYFPTIRILVISMIEKEETIIRMLRLGVKGYLSKDVEPGVLGNAINAIMDQGFYYTDFITGKLVHSLLAPHSLNPIQLMNDRERAFLTLACSELTYNEIAAQMFLSPKTIDGYRKSLFEKLNVKSRVGLALFAVRNGLVDLL
jgi:two-component system, NarL family, invasion response regulator UvrY